MRLDLLVSSNPKVATGNFAIRTGNFNHHFGTRVIGAAVRRDITCWYVWRNV
jgi:hypothetical protein